MKGNPERWLEPPFTRSNLNRYLHKTRVFIG